MPGPAPFNNIFSVLKLFRAYNNNALSLIEEQKSTYGDMIMLEILGSKQVMISNPDAFREVLVTKSKSFNK